VGVYIDGIGAQTILYLSAKVSNEKRRFWVDVLEALTGLSRLANTEMGRGAYAPYKCRESDGEWNAVRRVPALQMYLSDPQHVFLGCMEK
jgi:hypothetical protein